MLCTVSNNVLQPYLQDIFKRKTCAVKRARIANLEIILEARSLNIKVGRLETVEVFK